MNKLMKDWSLMKRLIWLHAIRGGSSPSWVWQLLTGTAPLTLLDSVSHPLHSLKQYGKCVQDGTPMPDAPVDIMTNNGAIKLRRPSGMPIAYQMVEWLKPAGSIPITGFKTKSTQEITTVFYRERSGASYLYSSDTNTSGTTNTTAYLTSGAGNWRWDGKSYSIAVSSGIKITSVQNEDGVWLNGTRYGYYTDAGEFISTNDLRLSSGENTTVRIYSMTIREGETVTLDLVPVQRVTDNAYGFYDKVSGNFYTNAEATFEAGDPIADPVEIYADGEGEVLTVRGKNLFDPTKVLFGYYRDRSTGNKRESYSNFMSSDDGYIPCLPDTAYTFVGTNKTDGTYSKYNTIYFFDSAKNYLGASSYQISQPTTGTTPNNCRYLQVRSNPLDTVSVSIQDAFQQFNWQIELGSTATAYEPYTAQTVTVPTLLSVDTVKDEWDAVGGALTHKIGVYVITGDESGWGTSSTAGIYTLAVGFGKGLVAICTHFTKVSNATSAANMSDGTFKGHSTNTVVYFKDSSAETLDAFKAKARSAYASGNPWVIVYALATETTEQTTPHALHTSAGTNVVDVTAAVEGVTVSVEYAKSGSAALAQEPEETP